MLPSQPSASPSGNLRSGRRLGVDVGTVRVGIALSDPDGLLAFPLETIPFADHESAAQHIGDLVQENDVMEVIVGLPRHLSGSEGVSAAAARQLAREVAGHGIAVRMVDERLTTTAAEGALRAAGRTSREHRDVIDQEAARQILQFALDSERASGRPPGTPP